MKQHHHTLNVFVWTLAIGGCAIFCNCIIMLLTGCAAVRDLQNAQALDEAWQVQDSINNYLPSDGTLKYCEPPECMQELPQR